MLHFLGSEGRIVRNGDGDLHVVGGGKLGAPGNKCFTVGTVGADGLIQTTQMVVGADNETDQDVILMADRHYKEFKLKRVYYSGYIPINTEEKALPAVGTAPPLLRENRLYQSDWLMRFYGFEANEIVNNQHPNLDLEVAR